MSTRSLVTALVLGCAAAAHAQAPYLVKDIWPGPDSSGATPGVAVGDRVFFAAGAPDVGPELWSSAGTDASTTVVDVTPGPGSFGVVPLFALGDEVFFGSYLSPAGLWKSDGTAAGTRQISPLEAGQSAVLPATLPGKALFGFDNRQPAVTDGTETGTLPVPPPLGMSPTPLSTFRTSSPFANGFAMPMESSGAWWTAGTGEGTTRLLPPDVPCSDTAAAGGRLFLLCSDLASRHLAVSDGTFAGTEYLPGIPAPVGSKLHAAGAIVFFQAGLDGALWRSDGTAAGTVPVVMPTPAPTNVNLAVALASNGILYFGGTTPTTGRELWRTDGTTAGTFLLRDIDPGPGSGIDDNNSLWMGVAGGGVVFPARTAATGVELWQSDGTAAGTVPLPDIAPGASSSFPRYFRESGGRVYFSAQDGVHGDELWALDLPQGAVAVDDVSVTEGDAGAVAASFPVRLQSASAVPVVVAYATAAGTAQAGADFTPQSGTLTFAPGERERTIEVPVLADSADETNESFTLVLTPVGGAVIAHGTAGAVIVDDDAPRIRAAGTTKVEGNGGTSPADFVVTLTTEDGGALAETITVRYAGVDGTAAVGQDYTAFVGTLSFFAGMPSGTTSIARIPVVGDTLDEPDETFTLALDGQNNAVVEGPAAGALILDDDGVTAARPVELAHGTRVRADLAPPVGRAQDRDYYVLVQEPLASYEAVVDETSGDAAPLTMERVAGDGSSVLQSAQPVGTGGGVSLRWHTGAGAMVTDQHVRVESASCGTGCGADDTYRLRFYETTLSAPRFNNTNGQATVLILQNTTAQPVSGSINAWYSPASVIAQSFDIPARGTLVYDTSEPLPGISGSLTVSHDAPYGALVGKAVSLEPAAGFSFDTPLTARPR